MTATGLRVDCTSTMSLNPSSFGAGASSNAGELVPAQAGAATRAARSGRNRSLFIDASGVCSSTGNLGAWGSLRQRTGEADLGTPARPVFGDDRRRFDFAATGGKMHAAH